jgi:hypothetical protein
VIKLGSLFRFRLKALRQVLVLSLALIQVAAGPITPLQSLPPSASNHDKLKYLTAVKEHIPNIFDNVSQYDTDLFTLLDQQRALVEKLESNSKYVKNSGRYPRLELRLEPGEARTINDDAVTKWQKELKTQLEEFKDFELNTALDQRLRNSISRMGKGSIQGFTTGLINSLPKEQRGALYGLNRDQQIQELEKRLPDQLANTGFKGEFYGLDQRQLDKKTVLGELQKKIKAEDEFSRLMKLKLVVENEGLPNQISGQKIAEISNRKTIEAQIKALAPDQAAELNRTVSGRIEQEIRQLYQQSSAGTYLNKPLILSEVPPEIGVFRGFMGGDCATQNSFGYVWGPEDRTFMVKASDGEIKGYVSATYVKQGNGEKSLYLHSINGPRISQSETQALIQGIHQARADLGVKSVILPSSAIFELNNFATVRSGIKAMSDGGNPVKINYTDDYSRNEISKVSEGKYELPEINHEGVLVRDLDDVRPLKVRVQPSTVQLKLKNISKSDGLMMALEYERHQKPKMVEKILDAISVDAQTFSEIQLLSRNESKKPIKNYLNELQRKIATLDPTINTEYLMSKKAAIGDGVLRASDAINGENLKFSKTIVLDQINSDHQGQQALAFMSQHPAHFRNDPKIMHAIKKMTETPVPKMAKIKMIHQSLQLNGLMDEMGKWAQDSENEVLRGNTLAVMHQLELPGREKLIFKGLEDQSEKVRQLSSHLMMNFFLNHQDSPYVESVEKLMIRNQGTRKGFNNAQILLTSGVKNKAGIPYSRNHLVHDLVFQELASENPMIKSTAAQHWALLDFSGNPKKMDYLKALSMSEDKSLRNAALKMAFQNPKELKKSKHWKFFLEFYRGDDPAVVNWVLHYLDDSEALKLYQNEKNPIFKKRLALKLGESFGHFDASYVKEALDSDEFFVINKAMDLQRGRDVDPEVFSKLKKLMKDHDNLNIRMEAGHLLLKKSTKEADQLLMDLVTDKIETRGLDVERLVNQLSRKLVDESADRALLVALSKVDDLKLRDALLVHLIGMGNSPEISDAALKKAFQLNPENVKKIMKTWAEKNPKKFPTFMKDDICKAIAEGRIEASVIARMIDNPMIRDQQVLNAIAEVLMRKDLKEAYAWNLFQGTITNEHYDQRYLNYMKRVFQDRDLGIQKIMTEKIKDAHSTKMARDLMNSLKNHPTCGDTFQKTLNAIGGVGL